MNDFDREAFLEWLDDQEGAIPQSTLEEQWPQFPSRYLLGVTSPFVDGERAYYKHDLRDAANRRYSRD